MNSIPKDVQVEAVDPFHHYHASLENGPGRKLVVANIGGMNCHAQTVCQYIHVVKGLGPSACIAVRGVRRAMGAKRQEHRPIHLLSRMRSCQKEWVGMHARAQHLDRS